MVTRREFIDAGCKLTGTLWAGSSAIAALAPARVWALELAHFNARQGHTLMRMTRIIYPHDALDDAVYALVVKDLDAAAAAEPESASVLAEGIENLDAAADGDWLAASAKRQLNIVETVAATPFFEKVRSTAIVSLYDNELAFAHFAYPGSAFEKGGYLHRGFDDLTWLSTPPPNASPIPER
ncbi:MAG TPA: tat (twin-arginine translocation) pathway signal sequence [Gammaproteobacteria bacterium]|jgi:hypothetical protein|nr:tat (twin-arginine translocation) pathway signal sequence [Gammaproteobacteria bacterium]